MYGVLELQVNGINQINSYARVVSDYKNIRRKLKPEDSAVNFKGMSSEINTRRVPNELTKFIVDANIQTTPITIKTEEKKKADVVEKYDGHLASLRRAPIIDRLDYVIEKLKRGEYVSATTMGILSIVYGPEDLREVSSAYRQIKALCRGENFQKDYDYKVAQHPNSFFRGSILHKSLNPFASKSVNPEELTGLKKWWHTSVAKTKRYLLKWDKALIDTRFGERFVKNKLGLDIDYIQTSIDEIGSTLDCPIKVKAYKFISDNKLGKLTARAMTRVPVIGTIADATIEALEVRNDVKRGENFFESAAKAGLRYATSTVATAYLGAIGSKAGPLGTLGSLTLANYVSDKIEEVID